MHCAARSSLVLHYNSSMGSMRAVGSMLSVGCCQQSSAAKAFLAQRGTATDANNTLAASWLAAVLITSIAECFSN